jgi:hypothetical protein
MGSWDYIKECSNQVLLLFNSIQTHKMSFSSSNHGSSSSIEEMFDEMDQEIVMFIQCAFILLNFDNLFNNKKT